MVEAFETAAMARQDAREGLTDVFAIVERDYRVEPLCLEESGVPGVRCAKLHNHVGVHHAALPLGSGMTW
jgi:hypothetical protein